MEFPATSLVAGGLTCLPPLPCGAGETGSGLIAPWAGDSNKTANLTYLANGTDTRLAEDGLLNIRCPGRKQRDAWGDMKHGNSIGELAGRAHGDFAELLPAGPRRFRDELY